jgi:hypothetical protein
LTTAAVRIGLEFREAIDAAMDMNAKLKKALLTTAASLPARRGA